MPHTEQALEALEKANYHREKRAQMKRNFKDDPWLPGRVLKDVPAYAERMPVDKFLQAIPGLGRVKVTAMLRDQWISGSTTLGQLTLRQRDALATELRERI